VRDNLTTTFASHCKTRVTLEEMLTKGCRDGLPRHADGRKIPRDALVLTGVWKRRWPVNARPSSCVMCTGWIDQRRFMLRAAFSIGE
jgi:hypothetical protein